MYKVLADFADMQDNGRLYRAGDVFPRDGSGVDAARIKELSSNINRRGMPLIEAVSKSSSPNGESAKEAENATEGKLKASAATEKPRKRRKTTAPAEGGLKC